MKSITTFSLIAILASLIFFTQCGGSKTEDTQDEHAESAADSDEMVAADEPQFAVDATFQEQLVRTFQAYLKVKDAFVATDAALVKTEARNLKAILKAIDPKMLSGPALNDWSNYANNIDMSLVEILATDDIEAQRTAFSALSDNLYKSIKAYGLGTATAYYEFCPMAFNDQGAYWLSDNKEIRNPYFGDKMLTCGRVAEELK
jgi:Cu(I)/Ag(I) efflux system membrane fusion protein